METYTFKNVKSLVKGNMNPGRLKMDCGHVIKVSPTVNSITAAYLEAFSNGFQDYDESELEN